MLRTLFALSLLLALGACSHRAQTTPVVARLTTAEADPVDPCTLTAAGITVKADEAVAVQFCVDRNIVPDFNGLRLTVDGVTREQSRPVAQGEQANAAGSVWYRTAGVLLPVGAHTVSVAVVDSGGKVWPASAPVAVTVVSAVVPECAVPLGSEAPSVIITRWEATSGRPGSRMRVNYQLASKSPITEVVVKLAGAEVARVTGADLTNSAGTWFTAPAMGSYSLSVVVQNAFGCTREAAAPFNVVVK